MYADVAIVGAGPAGLMAAKTAAQLGLKVAVLEKRLDVSRITRACCEQFIMDENYGSETLRIEQGRVVFTKNAFAVNYNGPQFDITDKYYLSPGGHTIHFAHDDGRPIVIKFDKGQLLQGLWQECEQAGVDFMPGTVVYDADDSTGGVELGLSSKGVHTHLKAQKLIVADGANSPISEVLGLNKHRQLLNTALCIMYYMEGIEGFEHNALKTYFGRSYQGLAPIMIGPSIENDTIAYVILTGSKNYPPPRIFENVTGKGALASAFKHARLVKKVGCTLNAFSPMRVPWRGNTLVIGDAAAYVEVETQGALMCGYHAGHAVAKAFDGDEGFQEYTRWWQDSFEFFGQDVMRVAQGFVLVPTYDDDELDYLFALIEDEVLEGTYNQYKSPEVMWGAILRHRETIQSERPKLYEKINNSQVSLSDMG